MSDKRIKLRTYFYSKFLILIVSILIIFTTLNYFEAKDEIIKKNRDLENNIEKSIVNNIKTVNSSYKMLGEVFNDELKKILYKLKNEYKQKQDVSKLDLAKIKSELDMNVDLYVINNKGVIIATTYPTDLGLDLSKYTGFFENLMNILNRKDFAYDALTPETQTGKLRKYAYLRSDDEEYIFEVGLQSSGFEKYLKDLNYFQLANKIQRNSQYVSDIKIFRASNALSNITLFGKPETRIKEETKEIIAEMYNEDIKERVFSLENYKKKYILLKLRARDIPSDLSKVVEITYDTSLMNKSLMSNLFSHLILSVVAILLSISLVYYFSKRFTQPISQLSSNLDKISKGDLDFPIDKQIKLKNILEVNNLITSINDMVSALKEKISTLNRQKINLENSEKALRESEASLRTVFEAAKNVAFIKTDCDPGSLKILEFSPGAEQIFEYTREEIVGKSVEMLHLEEEVQKLPEMLKWMRENMQGINQETTLVRKSGETFPALFTTHPILDAKGEMTAALGVSIDITERKQSEEELDRLRNYLSNIIDSMPSILVGVDKVGKVTQWNDEAQRVTEISSQKAIGQALESVFPRLSSEMRRLEKAMQTQKVYSEHRQPRKQDDETRYEDITVYPLVTNGTDGAVIRVDDVTEQVRIEEMMIQSEKMLSVGGLAAGMAHEINNPLGGILQTVSVMHNRLSNPEVAANQKAAREAGTNMQAIQSYMQSRKIFSMLERIRESGNRAAEIVANMLSFARKSDSNFSSCDLAELIEQCLELAGADYDLKKSYDFRKIKIERDYEQGLPLVKCESSKLQQVVLNILRNGAEAMHDWLLESGEARQPRFTFRLAHEAEQGKVRIEIEDNGPGMDEATRKRIFEPFFTSKPTDQGTGLGLSVSYFIITENHGGEMSVESTPGEGSKFIIKLPAEISPA
jgi:PAS domain S-box-containing protein